MINQNYSDIYRHEFKGYVEPVLLAGCKHQAEKLKITRSKYIRYAIINQLIRDKFPLNCISNKFNAFYKGMTYNL